jgi:predicted AlkP superfamily phosphohydrolase/phosphomutase
MNIESETLNRNRKLLVLGLDGMPLDLLLFLMESGKAPNLKALFQRGTYGKLRSVIPPITPAAWTSFQTGKYPDKHGVVDFFVEKPWTYQYEFTNSTKIKSKTLWKILSDAKRKPIVVNVPLTYPPEAIEGIIIPGFDAPETSDDCIHPKGLLKTIETKIGKYNVYRMWWNEAVFKQSGLTGLIQELLHITDSQIEGVKFLMKEFEWDFFMYHFQVTDALQHHAYHLINSSNRESSEVEKEQHKLIMEFYGNIDRKVGELLEMVDQDTSVCVLSDHGFLSLRKAFYLNHWLQQEGYLAENHRYFLVKILENFVDLSKKLKLPYFRHMQYPLRKNPVRTLRKINFKRTQAYAYCYLVNYAFLFVNKNLKVNVEALKRDLKNIQYNGEYVVKDVYPWYSGNTANEFNPDLVVEFVEGYSIMQKIPSKKRPFAFDLSNDSNHAINGMFCVAGNNIKAEHITNAEIVDIFPTILHMMDIPIPDDIDGKIITDAFEVYEGAKYVPPDGSTTSRIMAGTEDFEKVANRLMDLGYL